jgi:hypothetical protein
MSMVGRTTGARPAVRRTSAVGGGPRERDVGGARPVFDDRLGNAASTRTGSAAANLGVHRLAPATGTAGTS